MQLVDLQPLIPDLIADQRYATANNVTGEVLYHNLPLQLASPAAEALSRAAEDFRAQGLRLVVWDAYRPIEAHAKLRAIEGDTKYVAENSKHCLGVAVDLTLADNDGQYLDMGTDFDDFSPRAHFDASDLSDEQRQHRALLQQTMLSAGFTPWAYEWWHFEYPASGQ